MTSSPDEAYPTNRGGFVNYHIANRLARWLAGLCCRAATISFFKILSNSSRPQKNFRGYCRLLWTLPVFALRMSADVGGLGEVQTGLRKCGRAYRQAFIKKL
jgi:hypothetical protein